MGGFLVAAAPSVGKVVDDADNLDGAGPTSSRRGPEGLAVVPCRRSAGRPRRFDRGHSDKCHRTRACGVAALAGAVVFGQRAGCVVAPTRQPARPADGVDGVHHIGVDVVLVRERRLTHRGCGARPGAGGSDCARFFGLSDRSAAWAVRARTSHGRLRCRHWWSARRDVARWCDSEPGTRGCRRAGNRRTHPGGRAHHDQPGRLDRRGRPDCPQKGWRAASAPIALATHRCICAWAS